MRTTIDLPADLHAIAGQLAHNQRVSMSQVVVDLMRRALNSPPQQGQSLGKIVYHPVTGFPTMRLGSGPITTEMVRQMQDDE
ncbi:MAG: antitoxin [Rhodanobacteraceae bacterium]|nr:antitoxin [Rhodanobacteraceae bacterium]